jgi:ABC-2 type transport system ATP-binding protein
MLELRNLRRSFGDVKALDDVSFSVPEGSIVGFVGPNGAGKTTAMRIVLGVLEPDAGEVLWRGTPVDGRARRRFGYIPEERGLYPKMRVLDQLVYLARLHGVSKHTAAARATDTLSLLGIEDRAQDRVESLSLGNQQRVQLAAALVHEPEVMVLDEPFSGLDPVGVDVLAGLLRRQATNHGAPVVFSSHQLDLVERLCDAVVLIDRGHVVAQGTIAELRASREQRLVRLEMPGVTGPWYDSVPGVVLDSEIAGGVILRLNDDVDEQRVLDLARATGDVVHFSRVQPSLTELFREVVSG